MSHPDELSIDQSIDTQLFHFIVARLSFVSDSYHSDVSADNLSSGYKSKTFLSVKGAGPRETALTVKGFSL